MPRYQRQSDDFRIGEYWLSKQARSPAWCRTWFDTETRQTRRASLGTTDFAEAQQRLTDWFVLNHTKSAEPAQDVTLASIFARYFEHHGQYLKSAISVRVALKHWLDFHGERTIGEAAQPNTQTDFQRYLDGLGHSATTKRTVVAIGKGALNWAFKRNEIGGLPNFSLPDVTAQQPKGRPLDIDELAHLFRTAEHQHVRVFLAFGLGTAARAGALLDLLLSQIDLANEFIDLNPQGREQTKKHRPVVKLPQQLKAYAEQRERFEPLICYNEAPVTSLRSAWRTLEANANLGGNVKTYSLRHTVARWLRKQGVPPWEVAAQLGHKVREYSTTEIYAPFDPTYLGNAVAAIDGLLSLLADELKSETLSSYLLSNEA